MTAATFEPGDWADHKSGILDPRQVAEVDNEAGTIRLSFGESYVSDWLPAANYENLGKRES